MQICEGIKKGIDILRYFVCLKYQFKSNFHNMAELHLPEDQKNQFKSDLKALYLKMNPSQFKDVNILESWYHEFKRLLKIAQSDGTGFQTFGENIERNIRSARKHRNNFSDLENAFYAMKFEIEHMFQWIFKEKIGGD